jgi:hypothetical protein
MDAGIHTRFPCWVAESTGRGPPRGAMNCRIHRPPRLADRLDSRRSRAMPDKRRRESAELEDYQVLDASDTLEGIPGKDPLGPAGRCLARRPLRITSARLACPSGQPVGTRPGIGRSSSTGVASYRDAHRAGRSPSAAPSTPRPATIRDDARQSAAVSGQHATRYSTRLGAQPDGPLLTDDVAGQRPLLGYGNPTSGQAPMSGQGPGEWPGNQRAAVERGVREGGKLWGKKHA